MKALVPSLAVLVLAMTSATVGCNRNNHRDDLPSQTTTTGADMPGTTPDQSDQCESCDGGHIASAPPAQSTPAPAPSRPTPPARPTAIASDGGAQMDPGRASGGGGDPRANELLAPRSASEAAGGSSGSGNPNDRGGAGLFGPSLIPAPVAPTSPPEEVQGAGGATGSGATTGTGGGTMGTGGTVGGTHGGGASGTGGSGMTGGTHGGGAAGGGGSGGASGGGGGGH